MALKAQYIVLVFTGRIHGPWTRPVDTCVPSFSC